MATSTIPNPERITTKSLTVNSSSASGSGTVTVCGRVATLTGVIRNNNNVTGVSLTLASFSSTIAPSIDTRISVCAYSADGLMAEATVKTDGTIVFAIPSGYAKDMKLSGSWITKG